MKRGTLTILLLSLALPSISAHVFINEVELNPQGIDTNNEWVELYNTNSTINLSGWYITDKDANQIFLLNLTITDFFVLDFLSGLTNSNENISLYNNSNDLQDITGPLLDSDDDNRTWQRIPDGTGSFFFKNRTKGSMNADILIRNKTINNQCVFKTDNVTLSVNIFGQCIQNVTFSTLINGSWINFTGTNITNQTYITIINSSFFTGSELINWTVFATSCTNQTIQDGIEQFFVNVRTLLSINPLNPDGINGWFITEPQFNLSNPDATRLFYRWDSTGTINFTDPFKLENAPNDANITGGIAELTYWSNACTLEPEQDIIIMADFTNPLITNLQPPAGSLVFNNLRPTIQALLDEIYQSNSGINHSSVIMLLDGMQVAINVFTSDTIDAIARHNLTSDLSIGKHNVTINVTDYASHSSNLTWMFEINITTMPNFTIYSPQNISYNTRRILFNISATDELAKIEFINLNERNSKFKILCKNCREFGFSRERKINLLEGENNITIRSTDIFGTLKEQNISLFIDSKPPKISKTEPKKNIVTNGSNFLIKYSEDNLQSVLLSWNPNLSLNCPSGQNQICSTDLNLSSFNNQFIDYLFNLSDGVNTAQSNLVRVFVDAISPMLTINEPINNTYSMKAPFNISATENVLLEYFDASELSPRFKRLCSNCNTFGNTKQKLIRFKPGFHEILIRASDEAGNTDIKKLNFTII